MEQNFEPETILTDAPVDAPEEENSPSEPNCTSPSEPGLTPPAAPRFTQKQKTAAILSLAAGFFAVKLAIGNSSPLGAAIYTALVFILTAVFIFSEGRPIRAKDAVIPTAAVVLSAGCVLTSVPALRALIVLTEIPLYVYWVYCALSGSQESFPGKYAFFELLKGAFVTPIPSMGILWPAMFTKTGGKNKNTLWWILLGIVIALFPTAVIISLLSYDQAFTDLLGKLTAREYLQTVDLSSYVTALIFGVPVAMYVFALLYGSQNRLRSNLLSPATSDRVISCVRFAPAPLAAAAMTPALLIYVVFFISQRQNYIMAFTGTKPDGVLFSEYARSGFFELCTVAAINAGIILLATLFMRRSSEKAPLLRVYSAIYSVFTLVLIATALSKMVLYIREFTLTRMRLLTSCFMIMLALCFGAVLVAQFIRKTRLMGFCACAALLTLAAVSLMDVDGVIASYNVNAYISGSVEYLDVDHFYDLGYGAVAPAAELSKREDLDPQLKIELELYLSCMQGDLAREAHDRWIVSRFFGWSLPGAKAVAALEDAGYPLDEVKFDETTIWHSQFQ